MISTASRHPIRRSRAVLAAIALRFGVCAWVLLVPVAAPRAGQAPAAVPQWAEWVEPDFPFFSSVVDARHAGTPFPLNNLTPRSLVLRVGPDQWAAFDVDLLRVAAMWRGNGVTAKALAPGSYQHPDRKTPGGQSALPEPDGNVWLANGI